MDVQLNIPDSVASAMRFPEDRLAQELLLELSVALYAQRVLSFGKARELAGLSKYEFGELLGKREIPRHYGLEDLQDDLAYARRQ